MRQAIEKYGAFRGLFLGVKRLFRCNPFSKGGYDPLKLYNPKRGMVK